MVDYLRLAKIWHRLKTFPYKPIEQIQAYQLKKFKTIINHAYEYVPMYKELYKAKGFDPIEVQNYSDIEHVPVLTKDYIRQFSLKNRISSKANQNSVHKETTSGSTGEPIEIWTDSTESLIQALKGIRFLREWGYSPLDNTVQLWREDAEPKKSFIQKLGFFSREIVSIMDKREKVINNLMSRKCDVLFAVRSSLEIFGEELNKRNLKLCPKILISGSEVLTKNQRDFFKKTFGCETLEIYGTVETGNIAWSCPNEPNNLHIDMETVLVNFFDIETTSSGEKQCNLAVTNLENYIMPFIKFDPGDSVILPKDAKCTCNRTLPILGRISGRNDDIIEYKGRNYNFHFFYNYFKNYLYIRRYQVVKTKEGEIIFKIKLENDTKSNRMRCINDLSEIFSARFYPFHIDFVDQFTMAKSGKIKALINEHAKS